MPFFYKLTVSFTMWWTVINMFWCYSKHRHKLSTDKHKHLFLLKITV